MKTEAMRIAYAAARQIKSVAAISVTALRQEMRETAIWTVYDRLDQKAVEAYAVDIGSHVVHVLLLPERKRAHVATAGGSEHAEAFDMLLAAGEVGAIEAVGRWLRVSWP